MKINSLSRKLNSILKITSYKIKNIKKKFAFRKFIFNINLNFKKIMKINKNFKLKKTFLLFFKKVCKNMLQREKNRNKLLDITEYYNYKIKNKFFNRLIKAVLLIQQEQGISIRKKLLKKLFFENLKNLWLYIKKKNNFYRKLHLKKHFLKKWKFLIYIKKNLKIAKLKFISKFILNWRRAILFNRENKINSIIKFSHCFEKIINKTVNIIIIFYTYYLLEFSVEKIYLYKI